MIRKLWSSINKMFGLFLSFYKNRRFRQKLFISYIAVIVVPIIVLGLYSYIQARVHLLNQAEQGFRGSVNQITDNINFNLDKYDAMINYINYNKQVSQSIDTEGKNYAEISIDYNEMQVSLFDRIRSLDNDVKSLVVYSENEVVFTGDGPVQSMSLVKDKPWFNEVMEDYKVHWVVTEEAIVGLSRIYKPFSAPPRNLLYVEIDYDHIFNINMGDIGEYGVFITDGSNSRIFSRNNFADSLSSEAEKQIIGLEEGKITIDGIQYILIKNSIDKAGWTFYFYKPVDSIAINIKSILTATLLIVLCCFIILLLITWIFSATFVKRINYLNLKMKRVEEGDLKVEVSSNSNDEVGELIRRFSKMLQNINTLIDEVYRSHIVQKEAEMRALKAQINPHFLYNTLSLINWEAIKIKSDKIGQVARNMSRFYRTILNNGKNSIKIKDELSNAISYIDILLAIHNNSFQVEYRIDDEVYEYYMINIVLQPIIENAFYHGIYMRTEGVGKLTLSAQIREGSVYFTVEDNGPGMDKEKLEQIFVTKSSGYGLKNVQERLKIIFGEEYGVSADSQPGKGTCMAIRIPRLTNPVD